MSSQQYLLVLTTGSALPFAIADQCASFLDNRDIKLEDIKVLGDKGQELNFAHDPSPYLEELRYQLSPYGIDANVCRLNPGEPNSRKKKLLIADMDATIITSECIDELASLHGVSKQVKTITTKAMQGELDFDNSLRARVGLLKGLSTGAIEQAYRERISITPGANKLVETMNAYGAVTVLASGGFTCFAKRVAKSVAFQQYHANQLEIIDDLLTGKVVEPILGKESKRAILQGYIKDLAISAEETLAVGDGANDRDMIKAADFGVAFKAKPSLKQHAAFHVDHSDLTALLYLQGYREEEFVSTNA